MSNDFARCAFNAGEISPLSLARSDQEFIQRAAALMQGFMAQVQGGAVRPSGTLFLGEAVSVGSILLVPFCFNLNYVYLMEFSDKLVRFWRDDQLLMGSSSGNLVTNGSFDASPVFWSVAATFGGSPAPSYDANGHRLKLSGADYLNDNLQGIRQYSLSLSLGSTYRLQLRAQPDVVSKAMDDRFMLHAGLIDPGLTLSAATVPLSFYGEHLAARPEGDLLSCDIHMPAGSGTVVKDLIIFLDSQYGSTCYIDDIWMERQSEPLSIVTPYAAADLGGLRFQSIGDQIFIAHASYEPKTLKRTDVNAFSLAPFEPSYPPLRLENSNESHKLTPSAVTGDSITLTASWSYFTANHVGMAMSIAKIMTVNNASRDVIGWLRITAVASATSATAKVMEALPAAEATDRWSEGAWNNYNGYPAVVASAHDRLMFGGTPTDPTTYWLSERSRYDSFESTSSDSSAISYQLPDAYIAGMLWARSYASGIVVGTLAGEYFINSGANKDAWTPSTVRADRMSGYGSTERIAAIDSDNDLLFVQGSGAKTVRRFTQELEDSEALYRSNLLILAEHLTRNDSITSVAWAGPPFQTMFATTTSGKLIALTYMKEHQVFAWWRYPVGGSAKCVAALPGRAGYSVYVAVARTVGTTTSTFVEKLVPPFDGQDLKQAYFVASGVKATADSSSPSVTPISSAAGLGHLEGQTVDVVADGIYQGRQVVTGGRVTLPGGATAGVIIAGLPMECLLKLAPPTWFDQNGRYISDVKNFAGVRLVLDSTGEGLQVSGTGNADDWADIAELSRGELYSNADSESSETETIPLLTRSTKGELYIRQSKPMPVNILKVIYEY